MAAALEAAEHEKKIEKTKGREAEGTSGQSSGMKHQGALEL